MFSVVNRRVDIWISHFGDQKCIWNHYFDKMMSSNAREIIIMSFLMFLRRSFLTNKTFWWIPKHFFRLAPLFQWFGEHLTTPFTQNQFRDKGCEVQKSHIWMIPIRIDQTWFAIGELVLNNINAPGVIRCIIVKCIFLLVVDWIVRFMFLLRGFSEHFIY